MTFDRGVLIFLALFVTTAGIASLVSPESLARHVGWSVGPAGLNEVRAFYGGLQIGLGCFLIWCTLSRDRLLPGLLVAGFTVGGIGAARFVGLFLDRAPTAYHLANLAVEIATVMLVVVAISKHRKHAEP